MLTERSKGVVVVEDDFGVRSLLGQIVSELGYEPRLVGSAEELDRLLPKSGLRLGLFLLDVSLPGEDGLSLAERLREDSRYAVIPIVIVSAYTVPSVMEESRRVADKFVPKPFDITEMERTIMHYMGYEERQVPTAV